MDPSIQKLIHMAFVAKDTAYCPYSKFPVGSALLCKDGTYYTGSNIENAAYPLGVCAEKAVLVKAVTEGHRSFTAVAVCSAMKHAFISPCGSCRQFLSEFGMDMDVYMCKPDHSFVKMKIRELLPLGFEADKLSEERIAVPPICVGGQMSGIVLKQDTVAENNTSSTDDVTQSAVSRDMP